MNSHKTLNLFSVTEHRKSIAIATFRKLAREITNWESEVSTHVSQLLLNIRTEINIAIISYIEMSWTEYLPCVFLTESAVKHLPTKAKYLLLGVDSSRPIARHNKKGNNRLLVT